MGPFRMTLKAGSDDTTGSFSLLEADEPPGFGPPLHVHDDAAEAFYVLAGEYLVFIDDVEYRCPVGSFVFVPAGVPHGFRVGTVQSRKLNIYAPAAMVGYFEGLAAAGAAGREMDEESLAALLDEGPRSTPGKLSIGRRRPSMTARADRSRGSVLPLSVMRVCSPVSFLVPRLRDGYRYPAAPERRISRPSGDR